VQKRNKIARPVARALPAQRNEKYSEWESPGGRNAGIQAREKQERGLAPA
jgi:hypothetical protein